MPCLARGPVRGASRPSLPAFQRAVNCISGVEKPGQGVFLETEPPEGSGARGRVQAWRPRRARGLRPRLRGLPLSPRERVRSQCAKGPAVRVPPPVRSCRHGPPPRPPRLGGHAQPALATWPPAPLRPGTQDPALRTGGGQGKNQKLESLADLGPRREGGHTGAGRAENREILGRHT